ncbi:MAG: RdgB/HAM1 family non-canonical purine NTP pyrophosphatase [Actinomycetota bacterium]|nr:RdgB/HAM1 family non-canonical purine NTP pyrophosphatase [Actinomycetota bacterium]
MFELVLATANPGKISEIRQILSGFPVRLVTKDEVESWPEIVESGRSYLENALIKARALVEATGRAALADDSGIEVDALGGRPGMLSARFAGPGATDEQNNKKLAHLLRDVSPERRGARYRCVAVVAMPGGREIAAEATCEGSIATTPRGHEGFGYDPWFLPEGSVRTFAEFPPDEKHAISHRGKALRQLLQELEKIHPLDGAGGPEDPAAQLVTTNDAARRDE